MGFFSLTGISILANLIWPLSSWIFWSLPLVLLILLAGVVVFRPVLGLRGLSWVLGHSVYRLRVTGRQNFPTQGPALLVCNRVHYLDGLLLLAAQKRSIRLVMATSLPRMKVLRWWLRRAGIISLEPPGGPRALIQAFRQVSEALAAGELVCLFAEGGVALTGFTLPFHRAFEQIQKRTPVPVIPVCLDFVWGSFFRCQQGKSPWKWPERLPFHVSMAFGASLPPLVTSAEVRQTLQKLSADCSVQRDDLRWPIHRRFVRVAARHPFRVCFIDVIQQGKVFRYGLALAASALLGRLLRPLVEKDPMVGVWLPPSVGAALANLSLALLGKTSVNLNYTSSMAGVQSAIRQCGLRRVLTSRTFLEKIPLDPGPGVELVFLEDFRSQTRTLTKIGFFLGAWLLPGFVWDRWILKLNRHGLDDVATVIFSSGSTGDPKGIMLTHRNLAANSESVIQAIDPGPGDRLLGVLPFFHSFGFLVTLWIPLQAGASAVYFPDPRQAKEIGELCRVHRCTLLLMTATFLRFCLRRCQPGDFDTLRVLMCGAEKLPQSLAREFQEKFGVLPLEGYGCTELSPVVAANLPDWETAGIRRLTNRSGTIGHPIAGVAAKICDPETLEPLSHGQDGLLLIYGANVMQGYLNKPELTREVIRDGWYITGDIAHLDGDGFLTITDRLSRFSKLGGEMVPHQKIEDELHAIQATTERTCVVTAIPDEKKGERLVVLHLPLNGLDVHQMWSQLNSRGLPNLWVPAEKDFYQIPELPLLGSGKVDLKRVKDLALELAHKKNP